MEVEDRYIEFIQDILITIHENIRELNNRKIFADPEELPYIEAKLIAYHEFLSIIRMSSGEFCIPKERIGI